MVELHPLPLAGDKAVVNFVYIVGAFCVAHGVERFGFRRRYHARIYRYAAWGVPFGIFAIWTAAPAFPYQVNNQYICIYL